MGTTKLMLLPVQFFLVFAPNISFGQEPSPLTREQMYADLDSAVSWIKAVSPHLRLKKDLFGHDTDKAFGELRTRIDTVSSNFSFYLLIRRVLTVCQDMHTSYHDLYPDEMRTVNQRFKMYLPISYVDGNYIVREPFFVGGDTVGVGSRITHMNSIPVDDYVKAHLSDRYFSYDVERGKFYSGGFFKNQETLFEETSTFRIVDPSGRSKDMTIGIHERFNYLRTSSYSDTTRIEYWAPERALYVRLTDMDREKLPYLMDGLEDHREDLSKIDRIILDLRNNGGGEDTVWSTLYAKIIASPVSFHLKLADLGPTNNAPYRREGKVPVRKETNPVLSEYGLYTVVDTLESIEPAESSLRFMGKIIVLAENIFSSTGSSMVMPHADKNDNIISIGRPTGYTLGVGFSPMVFELPYSKMTFRVAPSIDVHDVNELKDVMHDHYDIELPIHVEDFIVRDLYDGDPFRREFMVAHDPFVKRALVVE